MKKEYPTLSNCSELQRSHLAWRIDRYTAVGLLTACAIARIERGDKPVNEILEECGMTPHQAKIHATKIINFVLREN